MQALLQCCPRRPCCGTPRTPPHECDGLTAYRQRPLAVRLPETEAQVQAVCAPATARACPWWHAAPAQAHRWGHAACAWASSRRWHASTASWRSTRQPHRARAVRRAQPGHQRGSRAARPVLRARPEQPDRLHHRRQRGRNSGGVHCLKYGLTVHNVMRVRGFTAEGEPWSWQRSAWTPRLRLCWPP